MILVCNMTINQYSSIFYDKPSIIIRKNKQFWYPVVVTFIILEPLTLHYDVLTYTFEHKKAHSGKLYPNTCFASF